ncbi:YgcG family protein [Olleya sp. ITB9]|uniref:TPM domain-containing protein n=1 Tax=Olleya sp. ITB9 TaxID=1715648 RepID=UPI0006D06EC5|nr:TPM domain-containing protein [Olleya sp. ITB9]
MKQFTLLLFFLALLSCKSQTQNSSQQHALVVIDEANFFTQSQTDSISKIILDFEKQTTNQICVYIKDSIPNQENTLTYATKLANNLGVGQAEKNNGLLLLISKHDRQIAIATGTETEKVITDIICYDLIENILVPSFKEERYFEGVLQVLDSVKVKWVNP